MGLNDQVQSLGGNRGGRKFIFKEGVHYVHMTGKDAKLFRILPAFHPEAPTEPRSWVPCIDPHGNLSEFGQLLSVMRFVGHGTGGGSRQDLLSLKTFGRETFCPLAHLVDVISQDPATWGYLMKDSGPRGDKNTVRAAVSKIAPQFVCNVLDINQTIQGVQLGVFSQSASYSLIDAHEGLVFKRNALAGMEEMIQKNYLYRYANGDITDPTTGPVLKCEKQTNKGDMSSYTISVALGRDNNVLKLGLDMAHMAGRINTTRFTDYINIPTPEDLVNSLVQLLNGRSPAGYHEHALLRLAFPQFRIPEPPAAPSAGNMVGGMGYAPQAPAPAPAYAAPQAQPQAPAYAGNVPAYVPQTVAAPQSAAPVPAYVPAAPAAQPTGFVPPAIPAQAPTVQSVDPVVPGDPVAAGFDQQGFMERLRAATGAAQ